MANHFDFKQDHLIAVKTELEVADLLKRSNKFKIKSIKTNNDNRWDLEVHLFDGDVITVEVKEDFTCSKTGNVGLEFECRGRPSGVAVSKADVYLYKLHEPSGDISFYIIPTDDLKQLIEAKKFHRIVTGGDPGSGSRNYLFKLDVFKKAAQLYHVYKGGRK